jgi:protein-disulfide isomerase
MSKKQEKEGLSKRQTRREELKKKERQQRIILFGALVVIALVIIGFVVVPIVQRAITPVADFAKITPIAYASADGTNMGDPNAKVKIEVFEDFRCHACQAYTETVEPQVIKDIVEAGKAYYKFYNYPFFDDNSTDKSSTRAAAAALCAADQNRFEDFKRIIFANLGTDITPELLRAYAKTLDLDLTKYDVCVKQNPYTARIQQERQLGDQMGVQGTPSLFVNGVEVSPGKVPTFDLILAAVNQAASGQAPAAATATP